MGALYGTFTVPLGKLEIVNIRDDELIVMLNDPLPVVPTLSLAWTVNTYTPTVVGVPATMPPGDMLRPGGNAPEEMLKMYGATPPDAPNAVEYAPPTVPDGGFPETVRGVGIGAATTIVFCVVTT
jgi:hypothetical protein